MRTPILTFSALACLTVPVAAEPTPPTLKLDNPAYSDPAIKWETVEEAGAIGTDTPSIITGDGRDLAELLSAGCRDTINKARGELGQPPLLNREPASPDKPHHIYAVDRREGGCSVMVMKGSPDDIRPLPAPMEGPLKMPAEAKRK